MTISYKHKRMVELARECVEYLAELANPKTPTPGKVTLVSETLTYIIYGQVREGRPDLMALIEDLRRDRDGAPIKNPQNWVLIGEVQTCIDSAKPAAWGLYENRAYERYKIPALTFVITPDTDTEKWASRPMRSRVGHIWTVEVHGPLSAPLKLSLDKVKSNIAYACLCMMIHHKNPDAAALWSTIWQALADWLVELNNSPETEQTRLERSRITAYTDDIEFCATTEWWRENMEDDVRFIPLSERIEARGIARGLEQGLERGLERGREEKEREELQNMRALIRSLATQNHLELCADSLDRLGKEQDLKRLQSWLLLLSRLQSQAVTLPA